MTFTEEKAVFANKYFGKFDTPKRLNRSAKKVPDYFIDKIENGKANSADIMKVSKSFPVFTYKTCITIHGDIDKINRQRVGSYKNIIQNQNGSLEIRWSAIDYEAKAAIKNYLRHAENWSTGENSTTGIFFFKTKHFGDKSEALKYLNECKEFVNAFCIKGMFAKVFAEGYLYFGRYYIYINVYPLSITGSPLDIASELTGLTKAYLNTKAEQVAVEQAQRQQQAEISKETIEQAIKDATEVLTKKYIKCQLSAEQGKVFVVPTASTAKTPCYRFYKVESKGTFGRVIITSYSSASPEFSADKLQPYMKGKQMKISDVTNKQTFLVK